MQSKTLTWMQHFAYKRVDFVACFLGNRSCHGSCCAVWMISASPSVWDSERPPVRLAAYCDCSSCFYLHFSCFSIFANAGSGGKNKRNHSDNIMRVISLWM